MTTFKGIYPALVTPSDAAGGVSVPALEALVDYLLAKNIDGLYIGGTTGEGIYMSVPDRQLLAEVVLKRVNGRIPVIVHVAAVAFADAPLLLPMPRCWPVMPQLMVLRVSPASCRPCTTALPV